MPCTFVNKSNKDVSGLEKIAGDFFPYAEEQMGFDQPVSVVFLSDEQNASDPLGKTAFYDPMEQAISLFIDGRHTKDILRSFSHELVHHAQNCRGEFSQREDCKTKLGEQGYAQKDEHLREMEREAYEKGNLVFRDWEDGHKKNMKRLYENMHVQLIMIQNNSEIEILQEGPVGNLARWAAGGADQMLTRGSKALRRFTHGKERAKDFEARRQKRLSAEARAEAELDAEDRGEGTSLLEGGDGMNTEEFEEAARAVWQQTLKDHSPGEDVPDFVNRGVESAITKWRTAPNQVSEKFWADTILKIYDTYGSEEGVRAYDAMLSNEALAAQNKQGISILILSKQAPTMVAQLPLPLGYRTPEVAEAENNLEDDTEEDTGQLGLFDQPEGGGVAEEEGTEEEDAEEEQLPPRTFANLLPSDDDEQEGLEESLSLLQEIKLRSLIGKALNLYIYKDLIEELKPAKKEAVFLEQNQIKRFQTLANIRILEQVSFEQASDELEDIDLDDFPDEAPSEPDPPRLQQSDEIDDIDPTVVDSDSLEALGYNQEKGDYNIDPPEVDIDVEAPEGGEGEGTRIGTSTETEIPWDDDDFQTALNKVSRGRMTDGAPEGDAVPDYHALYTLARPYLQRGAKEGYEYPHVDEIIRKGLNHEDFIGIFPPGSPLDKAQRAWENDTRMKESPGWCKLDYQYDGALAGCYSTYEIRMHMGTNQTNVFERSGRMDQVLMNIEKSWKPWKLGFWAGVAQGVRGVFRFGWNTLDAAQENIRDAWAERAATEGGFFDGWTGPVPWRADPYEGVFPDEIPGRGRMRPDVDLDDISAQYDDRVQLNLDDDGTRLPRADALYDDLQAGADAGFGPGWEVREANGEPLDNQEAKDLYDTYIENGQSHGDAVRSTLEELGITQRDINRARRRTLRGDRGGTEIEAEVVPPAQGSLNLMRAPRPTTTARVELPETGDAFDDLPEASDEEVAAAEAARAAGAPGVGLPDIEDTQGGTAGAPLSSTASLVIDPETGESTVVTRDPISGDVIDYSDVEVDEDGRPIDSDGDGVPDFIEDAEEADAARGEETPMGDPEADSDIPLDFTPPTEIEQQELEEVEPLTAEQWRDIYPEDAVYSWETWPWGSGLGERGPVTADITIDGEPIPAEDWIEVGPESSEEEGRELWDMIQQDIAAGEDSLMGNHTVPFLLARNGCDDVQGGSRLICMRPIPRAPGVPSVWNYPVQEATPKRDDDHQSPLVRENRNRLFGKPIRTWKTTNYNESYFKSEKTLSKQRINDIKELIREVLDE
jgi:hypothetical protein